MSKLTAHRVWRFGANSQRAIRSVSFGAAVAVITLAGAYVLVGTDGSPERSLNSSVPGIQQSRQQEAEPMQSNNQTMDDTAGGTPDDEATTSTSVTVNGQRVKVPANGTYNRSYDDNGAKTDISVNSQHTSTTDQEGTHNTASSSVHITVNSSTSKP